MQSKKNSFIESLLNVAIGFGVNLIAGFVIYPAFGVHVSVFSNLQITLAFTVMSIGRSYVIRRWFNARTMISAEV